jgi:ADP-ribosyl-[dinitrogen reductase] hydrolase
LLNSTSLEDTLVAAVNLGQDTDTTGAVAGALAGTRWGVEAIPDRWLSQLQPKAELEELADKLLELA